MNYLVKLMTTLEFTLIIKQTHYNIYVVCDSQILCDFVIVQTAVAV